MTVDCQARTALRNAIADYMRGAIHTFAFEDQYTPCRDSSDQVVQAIVRRIWHMHDEFVDHPISVAPQGWEMLRRSVAFLGTELATSPGPDAPSWPFADESDWHRYEYLVTQLRLPDYDPDVHGRPANPWWNRVPTSVGLLALVAILAAVFVVIIVF